MSRGQPRLAPGTVGDIGFTTLPNGNVQANAQIRLDNGKYRRIRRTGKSQAEAKRKIKVAVTKVSAADTSGELRSTNTVSELLAYWEKNHDVTKETMDVYKSAIRNHISPALGDLQINEITTGRVESFIRSLESQPSAAKQSRVVLSSAFSVAVRFDLLPANPVRETTAPKVPRPKPRAITPKEMAGFRAMVSYYSSAERPGPKNRAGGFKNLVDFIAGTGVRLSEALRLRWEDVDLATSPATAVIRPTKDGGESTRTIQLSDIAANALHDQERNNQRFFEWVFPSATGTHISKSTAERWIRSAREVWGESKESKEYPPVDWITYHSMRRNVATILADKVSLLVASQQLGHADSTITEHHYIEKPKEGPEVAAILNEQLI
ncbi:tyrosine-type recombinase/integrase [Corynebacterium sp. S7]